MPSFRKKIFLAFISLLLVSSTIYLDAVREVSAENHYQTTPVISVEEQGAETTFSREADGQLKASSGKNSHMMLGFNDNAVIRLAPDSAIAMRLKDFSGPHEVTLSSGRVWINSKNSLQHFTVTTPLVKLTLKPGVFDLHYVDGNLIVAAIKRSIQVNLLGNMLIIPEHRQLVLSEAKIRRAKDTIARLRYSKLFKEFPFMDAEMQDEWTLRNLKEDESFDASYQKQRRSEIRANGPVLPSGESPLLMSARQILHDATVALTFDTRRRQKRMTSEVLEFFDAALYAALVGKRDEAASRTSDFAAHVIASDSALTSSTIWTKSFLSREDSVAFAAPYDGLFLVRKALRSVNSITPIEKLEYALTDVIDMQREGGGAETRARVFSLLREFATVAHANLEALPQGDREYAFLLNISYEDFLRRHPELLREEFLKTASLFEKAHLASLSDKELLIDQQQYFVGEKLKRIGVIKDLMERVLVPFQDGRRAILLLALEIEAIKPELTNSAVTTYFASKINEFTPLFSYLRSTRAENLRGSFTEDFVSFKEQVEEVRKVTELLGNADGGGQISPFRREELAATVSTDIGKIGFKKLNIVLPSTEGDPRVRIVSAEFESAAISGLYDTSKKVMSEIFFNNEKIPNSVRLENIRQFFLIKLGKEKPPAGTTIEQLVEPVTQESLLEKVAKATVKKELDTLKINLEEKNLGLEDLGKNIVHLRLAKLGDDSSAIVFACDVDVKQMLVSKLRVQTVMGELPINTTFKLSELAVRVETIYKQALIDKQREESLKKAVNA